MRNVVIGKLKTFFGLFMCAALLVFLACCLPVYVFRVLVIYLANRTRPDLGEILNGMSSLLVNDYFLETPPRSNVVISTVFSDRDSLQDVMKTIQERWIEDRSMDGTLTYDKFQQHPVRWMGFTFWKWNQEQFSIHRHVHLLFGKDTPIKEKQIDESVEAIFNSRFPEGQSPWEVYVVENYQNPNLASSEEASGSVVIFKFHHCLGDGYSLKQALIYLARQPPTGFYEFSYYMSQYFRSCSWKIPDERKDWFQLYDKTDRFPISIIKEIKNNLGVTFTSVLLAAISSAVSQSSLRTEPVEFVSLLPGMRKTRKGLYNDATAVIFTLPSDPSKSSLERLKCVHETLEETQLSAMPCVAHYIINLTGCQCYPLNKMFSGNRLISMGLTNVPGAAFDSVVLFGKQCVDAEFICGVLEGDSGLGVSVISNGTNMRLAACAERGLFTKRQLRQFMDYMMVELERLRNLAKKIN